VDLGSGKRGEDLSRSYLEISSAQSPISKSHATRSEKSNSFFPIVFFAGRSFSCSLFWHVGDSLLHYGDCAINGCDIVVNSITRVGHLKQWLRANVLHHGGANSFCCLPASPDLRLEGWSVGKGLSHALRQTKSLSVNV
jgi:hypothetical protein